MFNVENAIASNLGDGKMGLEFGVPILGIVATGSNNGKTTLIEKLIPALANLGIATSIIKHVHHDFDLDTPGKDSFRFRQAGAKQVMVASDCRWALLQESQPDRNVPDFQQLVRQMDTSAVDLLLVEGLRDLQIPKLQVSLAKNDSDLIALQDSHIIALASLTEYTSKEVPWLDLNETGLIAKFIANWLKSDSA
jgi:molybdopterin-guanine dinucleotide biosynthesis protein MobB